MLCDFSLLGFGSTGLVSTNRALNWLLQHVWIPQWGRNAQSLWHDSCTWTHPAKPHHARGRWATLVCIAQHWYLGVICLSMVTFLFQNMLKSSTVAEGDGGEAEPFIQLKGNFVWGGGHENGPQGSRRGGGEVCVCQHSGAGKGQMALPAKWQEI